MTINLENKAVEVFKKILRDLSDRSGFIVEAGEEEIDAEIEATNSGYILTALEEALSQQKEKVLEMVEEDLSSLKKKMEDYEYSGDANGQQVVGAKMRSLNSLATRIKQELPPQSGAPQEDNV